MSKLPRVDLELQAYLDGELGWWKRRRVEARVRRAPAQRRELELQREIGRAARESETGIVTPSLWDGLSSRLAAIDAEIEAEPRTTWAAVSRLLPGWRPLGAATLAAAAALAWVMVLRAPTPVPPAAPSLGEVGSGVVRYLDTGGRSVMLMQETKGVTIIWLMDGGGDRL